MLAGWVPVWSRWHFRQDRDTIQTRSMSFHAVQGAFRQCRSEESYRCICSCECRLLFDLLRTFSSFVPNLHSKTKVQQLLLLNPLYEPQAWGEIILRIRIRLRICRPSMTVALQSSFRWRRHDNYIELICWESIRRKRLFPSLSINIIPKIQGKIEFWMVSSFTPN